jgi:hypothetical protein
MQVAPLLSPGATTALLVLVQSLPIASPRPADDLLPPAWARALVASKHPAALGALVRLASASEWFAQSPVHVALADQARAILVRASPALALAALHATIVAGDDDNDDAPRHGRPLRAWWSRMLGRSSRAAKHPAISTGAFTLLADLLSAWDREQHPWTPADYLSLCHVASSMTHVHSLGRMLDAFPVARDSALWRVAVGVGILSAVQTSSELGSIAHCAPPSSEAMARSVVAAIDERFSSTNHLDLPALLVVSQVATILSPFCSNAMRDKLRDACVDALVSNGSVPDSVRACATQLGHACAAFGSALYLIPIVHLQACKLSKDEHARGLSLLTFLLAALRNDVTVPGSSTLTPTASLLALDALALLELPVVANSPHRLLFVLAEDVASHRPSLLRLAELAAVSVTEPAAPRVRSIVLLYALVTALEHIAERRTSRHVFGVRDTQAVPPPESAVHDIEWLEVSALLRSFVSFSHFSEPIHTTIAKHLVPALALDACTEIVSSAVCSEAACDKAGASLWALLLAWFPTGHSTPQDLARALDAILSGSMSRASSLQCLYDLEKSSASWPNAERRQVAVVLALRAALRCDLRLLGQALLIAARLVRSEQATGIARDAVLSADAARKDAVLAWYFSDIVGLPRAGAKL